ncbi:hypothetical protein EWM64_g10813 [Hericium alpestre]|uniref:Uncharacterized protein n=1 Tax=Hericium alpestre TaxID=135208 RepID=A0A4Y9ZID3_9AGAM|nr:hypothetical protein EWM64_g10813 [Hericium alpestre]
MWDVIVSSCRSFPIANVRYLELVPMMSMPIQQWADALEKCRMVEEVRFQGGPDNTLDFCTALATHVDQEGGALLENLRCLTLDVFLDEESKDSFYKTFLDQLGTRQKARAIQTVCLVPRMMQEDEWFIRQLEEIVPQVVYESR